MSVHTRLLLAHALVVALTNVPARQLGGEVGHDAKVKISLPAIDHPVVTTDYRRRNKSDRKRAPRYGRRR